MKHGKVPFLALPCRVSQSFRQMETGKMDMNPARITAFLTLLGASTAALGASDYPIRPVPFTRVVVDDAFWSPRQKTSLDVTIPY